MSSNNPPVKKPTLRKRPKTPKGTPYSIADGTEFVTGCGMPISFNNTCRLSPIFDRFPPLPLRRLNLPDFEVIDSKSGFTHAGCASSLVIAVDGACPRNGSGATTSSIGIYFGPGNENNLSARIPDELAGFSGHTNNRAEIYAAIAGLKIARTLCERRGQRAEKRSVKAALERRWIVRPNGNADRLTRIVIKSDSAYVVSAVGETGERMRT